MTNRVLAGQDFQPLRAKTIQGQTIQIPNLSSPFVHLQFRRFAGCPICNLHLQSFVQRSEEIKNAGITEIVFFHSSDEQLLPYQGNFPFAVVGDPKKEVYKRYGVGSSLTAVLSPAAWPAILKGILAKNKPAPEVFPKGGPLGLPADFLIRGTGTIEAAHYGKHAYDQWSVNELLTLVRNARRDL